MKLTASYKRKVIALTFLVVFTLQLITPTVAYALTSGPAQPEMKGFEPIGNSNMVDLFSGDFSYNIPLLDVGGYPVNLAYHSGSSLDDEASWVGQGWSLNVGAINRQLRGLPDDFNGTDQQERELNIKDHVVKGANVSVALDLLGMPVKKIKKKVKKKKLNLTALTASIGVKHDNYRGVGVDLGLNAGLGITDFIAGDKSTKAAGGNEDTVLKSSLGVANLGLNLSSFEGAGSSINRAFLLKNLDEDGKTGLTKSIGFGYNSRAGLTGMTLSNGMRSKEEKHAQTRNFGFNSSFISFNSESYTPTIDHPNKAESYTFSLNLGPEVFIAYMSLGLTGFYSKQSTAEALRKLPAYGFLHSERGKDNPSALMDFNREKDIPYSKAVKYLPIPVPTYDLFTASSQDGSGQYRAYRGSSGVFFDPRTETKSNTYQGGVEIGAGAYFDIGADLYYQNVKTKTKKWRDLNFFLPKGDFLTAAAPTHESFYFKRVGEPVPVDQEYVKSIKNTDALSVYLPKSVTNGILGATASSNVVTKTNTVEGVAPLIRKKREVRNTTFSSLTAKEANQHALDKEILDLHPDGLLFNNCNTGAIKSRIQRVGGYRKAHHLSEITITGDDGKRSIYGLPVYNTYQEEVTFSIGQDLSKRNKGLIPYNSNGTFRDDSLRNKKGRDNYYSKEVTPPYATSYLLTSLLSPDYVDKTGNGITDDDLGTAVKFNYTRLDQPYKWRTPYAAAENMANYNENFLSDPLDDKANYVYGEKEVWYLHSIESKTLVAHFILQDREDGLGVLNDKGGVNTGTRLKKLTAIRLYSKSDLKLHGNDPAKTTPIKVVHLEYDYSLCKGLPNSTGNGGKLTLKKVYFTFGANNKGKLNPYEFAYDTAAYNQYDYRQYDRWGTFKDAALNPNGLNNSEFPYTLQDTALTNRFVSLGQLTDIQLPTGGSIHVTYESDDYAYVQDKRASQMCLVSGVGAIGKSNGLVNSEHLFIALPVPVAASELKERYFQDMDKLYFKFFLDLDNRGHKEFVPGYANITSVEPAQYNGEGKVITAKVGLQKMGDYNPIAKVGWQFLRMNLPKYAYPGYENLDTDDVSLKNILQALLNALKSVTELFKNFEKKAAQKHYSDQVDLSKSWVRLCSPEKKKLGGGGRVKRIDMSDNWRAMSGVEGAPAATYTQLYEYTTTDEHGRTISSGVASYEPLIGNDENPFRQPVNYKQKQFLGIDNYFYIEQPFGESYFPAANVGYSKVTVKSTAVGDENSNRTGMTVSEFYTARDYPTKVEVLKLQERVPASNLISKLIGVVSMDMVGLSQGYAVELNDMHGKPKAVNIYNKSGHNISSVIYYYKTQNEAAERKQLVNDVKVIDAMGMVSDAAIGMDVEVFSDMRQQTTDNLGVSAKISGGSGAILFFPLPFAFPGIGANYEKRSYRAASTIKIINRFAIQYKVKKTQDGSSITTENLLWDAETGNVLLTKTQNEFDDPVYAFAYPAHWAYEGMGQAYRNLGTVLSDFSTNASGVVDNSSYKSLLMPGDELVDVNSNKKYWVVQSTGNGVNDKRIINEGGYVQTISGVTVKLVRSGRRNMANTAIATITSLKNPIVGNKLDVSDLSKVLDAKATVFSEEWSMPMPSLYYPGNQMPCNSNLSCIGQFVQASMVRDNRTQPAPFYTQQFEPTTAGQILNNGYGAGTCYHLINGKEASLTTFYQYNIDYICSPSGGTGNFKIHSGDSAQLGDCKVYFLNVSSRFNEIANTAKSTNDFSFRIEKHPSLSCGYEVFVDTRGGSFPTATALASRTPDLVFRISCNNIAGGCVSPIGSTFNPYIAGILGNWRVQKQLAYQINRDVLVSNDNVKGSTNIRLSGAYAVFNPFWVPQSGSWKPNTTDERWIAANEVTYFNSKGTEIENKDALNRYSAALFGNLESLPAAVASNARYREIGYDGFEDYNFSVDCNAEDTCNNAGHFNFKKYLTSAVYTTDQQAHSGKYSLHLNGNVVMNKTVYAGDPASLFTFSPSGEYILQSNELSKGFSPIPGKKYLLSLWVNDNQPRNPSTSLQVKVNGGSNLINSASRWPIVEGWKRIEVPFVLPALATGFSLELSSGGAPVYLDDLRISPYDGQMKTFAYDASSQRLMAELDENNFATFYEYDDEGILIRVKKETERGIMTIKETRSSYRKRL